MLPTDTRRERGTDDLAGNERALAGLRTNPHEWALFLDIDGTLVDLADTPDAIIVPDDLPDLLDALSQRLNGALALVTGRALPYADQLFEPLKLPIAGLHGAQRRRSDGKVESFEPSAAFNTLKRSLERVTADWKGVLIEDKGAAVAAHFRQGPEWQKSLEAVMHSALEEAGPDYALQRGKMVIEIRPVHASKGAAVHAFLSEQPFIGRKPVTIGDDLTDEAMFKVANELGGLSVRVGAAEETHARHVVASVDALRALLRDLVHSLPVDRH